MLQLLERKPVVRSCPNGFEEKKICSSIKDAFEILGIKPFSQESVGLYKERMRNRINRKIRIAEFVMPLMIITLMTSFFSLIVGILASIIVFCVSGYLGWTVWFAAISFSSFLISLLALIIIHKTEFKWGNWNLTPLVYYGYQNVPDFVMQTVKALQKKYPQVTFYVDELRMGNYCIDPFLVAVDDKDCVHHYIDVWEEDFEERRR